MCKFWSGAALPGELWPDARWCLLPPSSPVGCQVAKSVEYVQAGTTHLVAAKRYQKSSRKWMCCCLILLLLVLVAVAIACAVIFTK